MPQDAREDLASFVTRMGQERSLKVEENLGGGFVRLRVSEAERRQAAQDIRCSEDIVLEMLRNARDAGARHVFVATGKEASQRLVCVLDDGCGIPRDLWERVFDARVTSKLESAHADKWGLHGRGMALFSIRENTLEARVVDSVSDGGSALRVMTDTERLPEKADQSTWPTIGTDDEGNRVIVRGPHNIVRACAEFALEERGACEVYVGSAAEIVATARARIRPDADASATLFADSLASFPVLQRFRLACDATELAEVAAACGLSISERTAHRIMAGQIRPLRSVYKRLTHASGDTHRSSTVDLTRDQRGLKLARDDTREFARMLERDFSYLADRYYLTLSEPPRVRIAGHRISVIFEYEEQD